MKSFIPHRYKRPGAIMIPLGFTLWMLMQLGYIKKILVYFFGEPELNYVSTVYNIVNAVAAVIGFFSFLAGIFFITFSKERVEDEMVQRTRLDSFQFAAYIQLIAVIIGFLFILIMGEKGESRLMFFLAFFIILFWISFIARFNYILHVKYRQ